MKTRFMDIKISKLFTSKPVVLLKFIHTLNVKGIKPYKGFKRIKQLKHN